MPNMAATPITMWKCPTTKYVACSMMSSDGCARKKPLTPPAMNIEMNPNEKREAVLMRSFEPYKLPSQIKTTMVDGIVMISVGNENTSDDTGFMPLTNI